MSGGNQPFIAMPKFPREQLQGAKNDLGSEFQRFLFMAWLLQYGGAVEHPEKAKLVTS